MKAVLLLALAMASQAYSQCVPNCAAAAPIAPVYPNCGCGCPAPILAAPAPIVAAPAPIVAAPAPIVAAPAPTIVTNSVAANLADTLSLLTVTSLLAETLPYGCGCGCAAPVPVGYPGCLGGYGYVL